MARVTRRAKRLRELDLPESAVAYVSMLESEGIFGEAVETSVLERGGVIGFDSSDSDEFASWNRDNPVRDVALALSIMDSRIWRSVTNTDDDDGESIKVKVRERVKDENGEYVALSNGKLKTRTVTREFAGVARTRTLSDERGQPVMESYRDEDGEVKRRTVKADN